MKILRPSFEASWEAMLFARDWPRRPPFSIMRMFTVDLSKIYLLLIELYIWTLLKLKIYIGRYGMTLYSV